MKHLPRLVLIAILLGLVGLFLYTKQDSRTVDGVNQGIDVLRLAQFALEPSGKDTEVFEAKRSGAELTIKTGALKAVRPKLAELTETGGLPSPSWGARPEVLEKADKNRGTAFAFGAIVDLMLGDVPAARETVKAYEASGLKSGDDLIGKAKGFLTSLEGQDEELQKTMLGIFQQAALAAR
ncbi:MAG: hypothetical protein ACYS22_16230 [Planctomycetota bacterium]|jgi:hypothetical protein